MIPQQGTLILSTAALRANVALLRRRGGAHALLGATIKANAYGHGLELIVPLLKNIGIDWACVYSLEEAAVVAGLDGELPILVMAPVVRNRNHLDFAASYWDLLHAGRVRLTLTDESSARALARALGRTYPGLRLNVHVQIDTGLTRQGVAVAEAVGLLELILRLPELRLEGVFTHLSHGDQPGNPATATQLKSFHAVTHRLKARHPHVLLHAQNSGGTWHEGNLELDLVRVGIALYGLQPSLEHFIPQLKPVARLVAPITAVHARPAGTGVGYGQIFQTTRKSRLAVVPVGYADGYPRELSGRAVMGLHGREVPVVGRISMDQTILDITEVAARVGDEVIIISEDPRASYCLDQLAAQCRTIGYELATRLGPRLHRTLGH